jgi:hypothetical protein
MKEMNIKDAMLGFFAGLKGCLKTMIFLITFIALLNPWISPKQSGI